MKFLSNRLAPTLALIPFTAFSPGNYSNNAVAQNVAPTQDRVIIQRRRIILRRPPKIARQFPERKTAIVVYPIVSGLSNPEVLRKVRAILSFKNIFDYSLDEYRNDSWLTEFGYTVNYNRDSMLDITFRQSGMAAYPDDQEKHFLIDLQNGQVVKAADVFDPSKLQELTALVDQALQKEISGLAKANASSTESAEEKESIKGAYEALKFELENTNDFMVGPKGVTFLYYAGFPHVIQALEPEGRYFFSYTALKDFIRRDGLLGRFKS